MWFYLALTSALFSAAAAITEKKALINNGVLMFSFILSIFNSVLSIPFLFSISYAAINPMALLVLFGKSILASFSFLFVMRGLKDLNISNSLPLLAIAPAITALFAWMLLSEKLNNLEWIGLIIIICGTYFLQLNKNQRISDPFKSKLQLRAYFAILGAVFLFSITSILDKTILSTYRLAPEAFLPIQHLYFTIIFAIMYFIQRKKLEGVIASLKRSWKIILVISVLTIVYRYSHILAVKMGSVALVLSIKRTSVLFATIIGGTYFKEQNIIRKAIATLLIVAGAIVIINS